MNHLRSFGALLITASLLGACETADVQERAPFSIHQSASYRVPDAPLTSAEQAVVVKAMGALNEASREADWQEADAQVRRLLDAQASPAVQAHLGAMAAIHMLGTYFADGSLSRAEAEPASFYADKLLACDDVRSSGLNRALVGLRPYWDAPRFATATARVLSASQAVAGKNEAASQRQNDGIRDPALTAERRAKEHEYAASVEALRAAL